MIQTPKTYAQKCKSCQAVPRKETRDVRCYALQNSHRTTRRPPSAYLPRQLGGGGCSPFPCPLIPVPSPHTDFWSIGRELKKHVAKLGKLTKLAMLIPGTPPKILSPHLSL